MYQGDTSTNAWKNHENASIGDFMNEILTVPIDLNKVDHFEGLKPLAKLDRDTLHQLTGKLPPAFFAMLMGTKFQGADRTNKDDWKSVEEEAKIKINPKTDGGAYVRIDIQTIGTHRAIMEKILDDDDEPYSLVKFAEGWLNNHPKGDEEYEESSSAIIYVGETIRPGQKRWDEENDPNKEDGALLQWYYFNHAKYGDGASSELTVQCLLGQITKGSKREALIMESFVLGLLQRATILQCNRYIALLGRHGSGLNSVIGGIAFGIGEDGNPISIQRCLDWLISNSGSHGSELVFPENEEVRSRLLPKYIFRYAEHFEDELIMVKEKCKVNIDDVHSLMGTHGGKKIARMKKQANEYLNTQMQIIGISVRVAIESLATTHPKNYNAYQPNIETYHEQTKMMKEGSREYWFDLAENYQGFLPPFKHESYDYIHNTLQNLGPKDWRRVALLKKGINYWGDAMAVMQAKSMERRVEATHANKEKKLGDVSEEVKQQLESNKEDNCTKTETEKWDEMEMDL